jgi:hypothetical protein
MALEHAPADLVELRGGPAGCDGSRHFVPRAGHHLPYPLETFQILLAVDRHEVQSSFNTGARVACAP